MMNAKNAQSEKNFSSELINSLVSCIPTLSYAK